MASLQLDLTPEDRALHQRYGVDGLAGIYGAGCTTTPEILLLFMNPTARNVSAPEGWNGIRAPWVGIRQTWKLLAALGLIDSVVASEVCALLPSEWNEAIAEKLYRHVAEKNLYLTNLAKCTQPDARHLPDSIFRAYLPATLHEIQTLKPKKIITLGNQVSSVLLQQPISVSRYLTTEHEELNIAGETFKVYPTYYPVGQGQRNMGKAVSRIRAILAT